ncbi:endolytic transglycosylase MltG [Candidatus Daviesbacteria bacterium]|nr:endolytic transglycosylase MltG [Candidatus Daviesbacteria bacterium]
MKKSIKFIIIITIIIFIIKLFWSSQLSSPSSDKSARIFVVDKGEDFSKVVENLKKMGLIKSSWAFTLYGKQSGLANQVQAGTFRLSSSFSAQQTLKTLTEKPLDVWVTLLEGWRVEEMADVLSSKFKSQKSKFIAAAKEGYMFPDTYLFPIDVAEDQIAIRLKSTFDEKYSDDLKSKIKSLGLTEQQGVILASIVEREARSDKVRTEVASILLKRLKIGMGLNADATIQYALGYQEKEKSWWKRNLTQDDLKIPSPYNTYLYRGLPPGPICNPSLSSLKAVANADSNTPYLYYYHDPKGNSYYAKTLEEHNQNVASNP